MRSAFYSSILAFMLCLPIEVFATPRGGLEFSFANVQIQNVNGYSYLSYDVMLRGNVPGDRLGTGLTLINYDPGVFGYRIKTQNNLIVTKGTLLNGTPSSYYNLYIADSLPTRIGLTYEYYAQPGSGHLVPSEFVQLLNVKMRIQNFNLSSGISFHASGMSMQQYLDDNITNFSPVSASSTIPDVLPSSPTITSIVRQHSQICISWQAVPNSNYSVLSATEPNSETWIVEAADINSCNWSGTLSISKRFYKVTAHNTTNYERRRSEIEP